MTSPEFSMKMRQYLAEKGDFYAIEVKDSPGSGAALRFAIELAKSKVDKANVRGLESLAWSTESVADILDYIRMRVGRDNRGNGWANDKVGIPLANHLEALRKDSDDFFKKHTPPGPDAPRQLHLELCREFIKHLTALYEFCKNTEVSKDELGQ